MDNSSESKLFGLPRPLAGGLIGVLIFLVILLPLKYLDYSSILLYRLALNLELPGRLTIVILATSTKIDMPASLSNLVSIAVSAIPAWISGWQIGSRNESTRRKGIVFTVAYLLFIIAFGTLLTLAGI
ncbi:MAG: hypothetical protein AB1607_14550 [Chloroflexota bacterium]